jgi:transcriptional regulator with XRE-family HTH domain
MPEKSIAEAIKSLREAMDVSQVTLSVQLKKSLTMIQRYERGENVPVRDLAAFVRFARNAGRSDLAGTFKKAVWDVLGDEVVELIRETDDGPAREETAGKSQSHKRRFSA